MTRIDAIVNAAKNAQYGSTQIQYEAIAAATLRAAINQVVPPDPCGDDCCITVCEEIRSDFFSIVTKLEAL
tara:strand:- start:1931 stop:2143 length:213 start_codon:yes stop_codon:yes gene_type:complete